MKLQTKHEVKMSDRNEVGGGIHCGLYLNNKSVTH